MLHVLFLDVISRSGDIDRKRRLATHNYRFLMLKLSLLYSLCGRERSNEIALLARNF